MAEATRLEMEQKKAELEVCARAALLVVMLLIICN